MRTSSSWSAILQHNYICLSKSCAPLVYITLSSMSLLLNSSAILLFPSKDLLHFPTTLMGTSLVTLFLITFSFVCSYHIFVAVSQIYFAVYGTISFISCRCMTLINTSLFSIYILPKYFAAEWETESFCSFQMEGRWRKAFLLLSTTLART